MCVKGYGLLSFTKNRSKHLRGKYSQKLFNSAKELEANKIPADAFKIDSRTAIQKTADATGGLICNKITN